MKIIFSREAIRDLQRLRQFITVHNPAAADKVAKRLRKAINQLVDFPLIGVPMNNDLGLPLRELIIDNYVVSYAVSTERVHILQIWHGKEKR